MRVAAGLRCASEDDRKSEDESMNHGVPDKSRPVPSISTVYRPIEEYWESSHPAGLPESGLSEALYPLDALLIHRLLTLVPGRPLLIDAAIAMTGGASCVLGLAHPSVRRVWAITEPGSLMHERSLSAVRGHFEARDLQVARLELVAGAELPDRLADQTNALILAHARMSDGAALAEGIGRWLDRRSDSLVLVLGLGRTGDCPGIEALLSLCAPGSGWRLQLMRELHEVFMTSRLAIVARRDHPYLGGALARLEQLYSGNYRYLDLVWRMDYAAMREAQLDAEILRNHGTFGPISEEIEGLKRAVREANERAAATAKALHEANERAAATAQARPEATAAAGSLARLRRKLSPTPVGRAYRLSKRIAKAWVGRRR
jgi:hypothetical protein